MTKVLEMFHCVMRSTENLKQNITNAKMKELATVLPFLEIKKKRIISFIIVKSEYC